MEWDTTYGGDEDDYGYSVQQTSDGGFIIAGWTYSYGAGGADVYLIKADSAGNMEWDTTYGGIYTDIGPSVQQTSDGGFIIAGYTNSYGAGGKDVYLIKADSTGNMEWDTTYGGTVNDFGLPVQQTSDGGFIVAGWTESYGAGEADVYLIKTEQESGIEEEVYTPEIFHVSYSEPNPFTDRMMVKYELPKSCNVHINVYNMLGQAVRELLNERKDKGVHTVTWDGSDNSGIKLSSGIYFLKVEAEENKASRKLILIR
jgi:predicted secreted protein